MANEEKSTLTLVENSENLAHAVQQAVAGRKTKVTYPSHRPGRNSLTNRRGFAASSAEYNGYFKIILKGDNTVKVVDGATYDPVTGTSGYSICRVNNLSFTWSAASLGMVDASVFVYLKYDAENNSLVAAMGDSLPENTDTEVYYQIGRILVTDGVPVVVQDHMAGIPQIWWFYKCQ